MAKHSRQDFVLCGLAERNVISFILTSKEGIREPGGNLSHHPVMDYFLRTAQAFVFYSSNVQLSVSNI